VEEAVFSAVVVVVVLGAEEVVSAVVLGAAAAGACDVVFAGAEAVAVDVAGFWLDEVPVVAG